MNLRKEIRNVLKEAGKKRITSAQVAKEVMKNLANDDKLYERIRDLVFDVITNFEKEGYISPDEIVDQSLDAIFRIK